MSSALVMLLQDVADLSVNAVQGYMLPWDLRRLVAALCNLLAPEQRSYGLLEPSLFPTARGIFAKPLPDGEQSCALYSRTKLHASSTNTTVMAFL